MSLTPNEAADALRDIETAGRRSAELYGYRLSSGHLIIWGLVWAVCYTISDLRAPWADLAWIVGIIIGSLAGFFIGTSAAGRRNWRFPLVVFAMLGFIGASYAIFGNVGPRQQAAFIPLVIATVYTVTGLWLGWRFVVAGLLLAVLTLGGFFYLHEHFLLWMAGVGGGGLILAGLWMRTA